MKTARLAPLVASIILPLASRHAHAQFAVIDDAAIAQLVTQVQTLARQLAQAQAEYRALTGGRGMERLLGDAPRNYLPAEWSGMQALAAGQGGTASLRAGYQSALAGVVVLQPGQLNTLTTALKSELQARRTAAALDAALAREALRVTSARFASLQQLIASVGRLPDPKSALDLQARIAAEQGMLINEQTKLQLVADSARAERALDAQRNAELAIAAQGEFASRFRPRP